MALRVVLARVAHRDKRAGIHRAAVVDRFQVAHRCLYKAVWCVVLCLPTPLCHLVLLCAVLLQAGLLFPTRLPPQTLAEELAVLVHASRVAAFVCCCKNSRTCAVFLPPSSPYVRRAMKGSVCVVASTRSVWNFAEVQAAALRWLHCACV